jgi:hypothetical protein
MITMFAANIATDMGAVLHHKVAAMPDDFCLGRRELGAVFNAHHSVAGQ